MSASVALANAAADGLTQGQSAAVRNTIASEQLDAEFAKAIDMALSISTNGKSGSVKSISELLQKVTKTRDSAAILMLLQQERSLIMANLHQDQTYQLVRIGLKYFAQSWAQALVAHATREMDNYGLARLRYELARHYARVDNWQEVSRLLDESWLLEQLPKVDADYAQLLKATALQKQKKHREAIKIYESVAPDSSIYADAQLNLATAYLRQEWWTDAQLALESLLKVSAKERPVLANRARTLMGYAQIQYGFYRDARSSFRAVTLESPYLLKAALGLGLAALNQKDFAGALAVFERLRERTEADMSVSEAHLLYAFTLRQMQQQEAAEKAYQSAIDYYQDLLATRRALPAGSPLPVLLRSPARTDKSLQKFSAQLAVIASLESARADTAGPLIGVKALVQQAYQARYQALVKSDVKHLESYLSQSQFGLASLYD